MTVQPHVIGWAIDEGRPFTAWFNGVRRESNFMLAQHVAVDCDTMGVDGLLEHPFVNRYATIVYATPSSTPEASRSRAVFLLDTPIRQAVNYRRALKAVAAEMGDLADPSCLDVARFFYGNMGCMPAIRESCVLPLETLKRMIADYEARSGVRPPPPKLEVRPKNNGMPAEWYRRLVQELADWRADDYADWITVGMACSTLGADGLEIWREFSMRSGKYKEGECEQRWRTFNGHGVTMATVVAMHRADNPVRVKQ